MTKQPKSIESLGSQGRGVRIEFGLLADRYCQKIYVVNGESQVLALQSSETEPADCNLSVPALQALNVETIAGRPVAALVGMSGSCHWSFTVEPSPDASSPGIVFDAAVRMKAAVPRVSTVYQLMTGAKIGRGEAVHKETVHKIVTAAGNLLLRTLPADAEETASSPVEAGYYERQLIVRREIAPPDTLPATVRWRYELALVK